MLTVRFHEGRYHGSGDWPPSPARLFQALIAGVGLGGPLRAHETAALQWLERLDPPIIAAPRSVRGTRVKYFVPRNDIDKVGGDRSRVDEIRMAKQVEPHFFSAEMPILYGWPLQSGTSEDARETALCGIAENLYQLGHGFDMAWASAEVIDDAEFERKLAVYHGAVHRPMGGRGATIVSCPQEGSLRSLEDRHAAASRRFETESGRTILSQAPRPRFASVGYDAPADRVLFDILKEDGAGWSTWPIKNVAGLVRALLTGARERLSRARPDHEAGSKLLATTADIVLIPIPSIGSKHADFGIRRFLLEIQPTDHLSREDIVWAFSGLRLDRAGAIAGLAADQREMLDHFGLGRRTDETRTWRTVTPAVLFGNGEAQGTERGVRPHQMGGTERSNYETNIAGVALRDLRNAGINAPVERVRIQREPFDVKGTRSDEFAADSGFPRQSLWHIEFVFRDPIEGLVVVGKGKDLGLGLMAPARV